MSAMTATEHARRKFVVTSTWGQHHFLAWNDTAAEEAAEAFLDRQGYPDPANMILDGLTEEYDPRWHGEWDGEEA